MRVALIVAVFISVLAGSTLRAEPPTKEQIARWIKELGDDDYATREQASKRLWQAGEAVESAVFEALKSPDPEVLRRARALAQKFKWGLYPDTPPRIVERIERYRGADDPGKQAIIKELFDMGGAGCTAILKIAAAEDDDVRPRVFQQIAKIDVELDLLEVLQARALHQLGEKEKAEKLFADLGARIAPGHDASWHEKLIEVECRLGLRDQACEHCARVLAITKNQGRQASVLGKVFPGQGETAAQWWRSLRPDLVEETPRAMKRLCDLLDGRTRGKELDDLIGAAKVLHPDAAAAQWMLCIYDVYLNAGMEDRAREYLDAAATSHTAAAPHLRLGDYLAERGKWELAVARYGRAWDLNRKEPLPLFLKGWALARAGQEQEGRRLMELAHWLPLGNESARHAFLMELAKRRQRDAARREACLLIRLSVPGSFFTGEGFRQLALDAMQRNDHLEAAAYHELAMLRCLRSQTTFQETTAYLGVPHLVHRQRAAGLLAAGRIDKALKEAEICLAALPGNSDLQALLVPELEKRGRKTEADALFARCFDLHAKLCQDYPNSAWAHNSLAWLCASTRRNLDDAATHANKAVALEPANAGFHDTLAETYFQRGDSARAIEEIWKSIALDGKRAYFKKQLKRFEAGDPKAMLPSAGNEE